ncbi:MAG: hypothetical protein DMF62_02485 [Acidobacteria bacterium]|nr:MAG: hypothetical protein DMF62_02485 [Acidobacteriota bacterium]
MKVKFLGITQESYRTVADKPPVRTLQVTRGAIVDLPEAKVKQLQRDYPQDWEVIGASPVTSAPEPADATAEPEPEPAQTADTKGEESAWTRKRAAKK